MAGISCLKFPQCQDRYHFAYQRPTKELYFCIRLPVLLSTFSSANALKVSVLLWLNIMLRILLYVIFGNNGC